MPEYNLLTEKWIPVQDNQKITLRTLLCSQNKYSLALNRDDMELACLQMIICMVQVIFIPEDFNQLEAFYNNPIDGEDYNKSISHFQDWFDVLHPEYPFMQTKIRNKTKKKSLQKLFIGLPEESSPSQSSNAHFNRTDEIEELDLGEAAVALFQQATNGHGLGGRFFSVGLKGLMPVTTLVYDESRDLRKTIWCNIIHKSFLMNKNIIDPGNSIVEEPTWVKSASFNKNNQESASKVGLMRGLFFQPAKVQLKVNTVRGKATGFFTENGMSYINGFWRHLHTPTDVKKLIENNEKKKPYMALSSIDKPLWTQMLGFFYAKESNQEGYGRAVVVDSYVDGIGRGKCIHLAVGGYIKGKSTESVLGRKHEFYSLQHGFNDKFPEMKELIECALNIQKVLNTSIYVLGKNLKEENSVQGQEKSNFINKQIQLLARKIYFNHSESFMHETLSGLDFNKIQEYKKKFSDLAKNTFKETIQSYEHDPKLLKAIEYGRKYLNKKLDKLLAEGRRNAA